VKAKIAIYKSSTTATADKLNDIRKGDCSKNGSFKGTIRKLGI
jgi:hypothetical protein